MCPCTAPSGLLKPTEWAYNLSVHVLYCLTEPESLHPLPAERSQRGEISPSRTLCPCDSWSVSSRLSRTPCVQKTLLEGGDREASPRVGGGHCFLFCTSALCGEMAPFVSRPQTEAEICGDSGSEGVATVPFLSLSRILNARPPRSSFQCPDVFCAFPPMA